ncbi:MarR family winged helix-turn-helix transcriptional regulator [Nonomuraea sp. CA-141351]|uniref:MarR family winged helix-turn-helix transcriptional regulator n=1 Tax=Nonomuraea sp. CA-141351 TaxID=3239996 RepID=UPI003D8A71DD
MEETPARLAALDEFGVASQAELGRRCNMDRSDVVAAINELAEQGFVERTPDPDDRRRNLVTLTTAGDRQLRRMDGALDKVQDDLLGPLPAEDRPTLTHLLTQLLTHHQRGQASPLLLKPRGDRAMRADPRRVDAPELRGPIG